MFYPESRSLLRHYSQAKAPSGAFRLPTLRPVCVCVCVSNLKKVSVSPAPFISRCWPLPTLTTACVVTAEITHALPYEPCMVAGSKCTSAGPVVLCLGTKSKLLSPAVSPMHGYRYQLFTVVPSPEEKDIAPAPLPTMH